MPDSELSRPSIAAGAPVQIGIVGCGAIAQVVHLPILSQMESVRIRAICDPDLVKAEMLAERLGIPSIYESYDELLERQQIDAVVICTPNHLHADQTERALAAGKDVLCERPLGVDRSEVSRLLEISRESGSNLVVAHNHRYRPDVIALKEFLQSGEIGEIYHSQAVWRRRRTRRPRPRDWRRDPARAGGGVLIDLGIQMLDLGLWLLDYPKPERVTAHLRQHSDGDVDDLAVVLVVLEGGITLGVDVTWRLIANQNTHGIHVIGARGTVSLAPYRVEKEEAGRVIDVTPELPPGVENVFTASYRRELDHFVSIVRGETEWSPPEDQERLMAIVDACYTSAEEGHEIVL